MAAARSVLEPEIKEEVLPVPAALPALPGGHGQHLIRLSICGAGESSAARDVSHELFSHALPLRR